MPETIWKAVRKVSAAIRTGAAPAWPIECQAYPNSPNCPGFPSTVLRPGEIYNEKIVFRFETDAN